MHAFLEWHANELGHWFSDNMQPARWSSEENWGQLWTDVVPVVVWGTVHSLLITYGANSLDKGFKSRSHQTAPHFRHVLSTSWVSEWVSEWMSEWVSEWDDVMWAWHSSHCSVEMRASLSQWWHVHAFVHLRSCCNLVSWWGKSWARWQASPHHVMGHGSGLGVGLALGGWWTRGGAACIACAPGLSHGAMFAHARARARAMRAHGALLKSKDPTAWLGGKKP